MKKNILLVAPYINYDVRANWIPGGDRPAIDLPGTVMPLSLATVAALTPDRYHVDIWDECIKGKIDDHTPFPVAYDLVGITGYIPHLVRVKEIIPIFRNKGITVAVGGPGVSAAPHLVKEEADIIFMGEAELTWPQFLKDWEAGAFHTIYRQIDKPDMANSPIPKWDAVKDTLHLYANGCLQTTRGCPFDCEFCDVIYLYGRRQRHKPIENVLAEIRVMQQLGTDTVFISDDEFIGNPKYAKELLKAMIPVNNSFPTPLRYRTQLTMNISKDDELLELMADANFDLLVIGIETPNKESLKETGKYQNVRKDLVADVHKVLSYGLGIRPGMIVGFDHDGPDIFDIHYKFIQESHLPLVSLNMLKAPIGTRLWTRMRREGRMLNWTKMAQASREGLNRTTNIVPMKMTRPELMRGFCDLMEKINDWKSFGERVRKMVSLVKREPQIKDEPMPVDNLMTLGERLGVEPEGCAEIRSIFEHTRDVAPYMWRKVRSYTGSLALYRRTLPTVLAAVRKQADDESSGRIQIFMEDEGFSIPAAFLAKYKKEIFPPVYRRAYINLHDKSKLADVLVDVFVDFLVHWKDGLDEFTAPHVEEMKQLIDRACAQANGVPPQEFIPDISDDIEVEKPVLFFHDEVLKSVGQDLIASARGVSLRLPELHEVSLTA
ncbi:MAG: radical SAM protein [Planctomycetota bacterium]